MFTGIVEEIGVVHSFTHKTNLSVLKVKAKKVLKGTKLGDSICVNGVCLTVTKLTSQTVTFDLMKETIQTTSLKQLKAGAKVNLERALKPSSRLGGHFVSGHVDNVGTVKDKVISNNYLELQIGYPRGLRKYFVPKGSVCLDGVSLTVGAVKQNYFSVYLIPFTLDNTNLGGKRKGSKINIETDILAKYVLNNN